MAPSGRLPVPGVDCHAHLEGSLDPAWVREQAARRGRVIPQGLEAFWRGETHPFEAFLEPFFFVADFLTTADSVQAAIRALLDRLPEPDGSPRGIDLWLSPHYLVVDRKQISLDALWRGVELGLTEARSRGIALAVLIDAINHLGPSHGHEVLDLILPDLPEWIVGFSTGGLERVPFRDWAPVFERARRAGLRLAAHAGENGPGENVREAVLHAGVERIVHGVRAAADPGLLAFLAERDIFVNVCIRSNRCLVPGLDPHPLPEMLRAGVACAMGTDDPGIMPSTMALEFEAARSLGLERGELESLRTCALERAWCLHPGPGFR